MNESYEKQIGTLGNYYSGLYVKYEDERYYWSIHNYDGRQWEEIPEYLFRTLVEYENSRNKNENIINK